MQPLEKKLTENIRNQDTSEFIQQMIEENRKKQKNLENIRRDEFIEAYTQVITGSVPEHKKKNVATSVIEEVFINQISPYALTQHKWKSPYQMKQFFNGPEFIDQQYEKVYHCSKIIQQKFDIKTSTNQYKKLKYNSVLDSIMNNDEYIQFYQDVEKTNQSMYGMKKNDYGKIVRYSKVDGPPDYANHVQHSHEVVNIVNEFKKKQESKQFKTNKGNTLKKITKVYDEIPVFIEEPMKSCNTNLYQMEGTGQAAILKQKSKLLR